jgi:hypothetical protein
MDIIKKEIRRVVTLEDDVEDTHITTRNDIMYTLSRTMGEYTLTGTCIRTEIISKATFTDRQITELQPLGLDVMEISVQAVYNDITRRR